MGGRVQRFEDLVAWQKARELAREVYLLTRREPLRREFALADQMTRAARSVMADIAEGVERTGAKEFQRALSVSKGSCAEVKSDVYLLSDTGLITTEDAQRLFKLTDDVGNLVGALRRAVACSIDNAKRSKNDRPAT